jgi:uncharacterized membrane protein
MAEPSSKYNGVGGWLLVFCIIIAVITPILSASQIISGHALAGEMEKSHKIASIVESSLSVLLHIYGCVTGIIIWVGSKSGLKLAKQFLTINLIGFFIIGITTALICQDAEARHKIIGGFIILTPKEIIFFVIWWLYFNKSKRVKALYEN